MGQLCEAGCFAGSSTSLEMPVHILDHFYLMNGREPWVSADVMVPSYVLGSHSTGSPLEYVSSMVERLV